MSKAVMSHLALVGFKAKDKVTGFTGVISTVSFDLYGCIQYVITPNAVDGKLDNGHYFDVTRVDIMSNEPVMTQPNFDLGYVAEGKKGCADKPLP